MGYKLRRWLALILPPGTSFGERLVALEIADQVNDDTRVGTAVDLEDVARRTGLANAKQVGAALGKLATRGLELRIAIGERHDGKPVFSYPGRKTNYRVPTATELDLEKIPPTRDHTTPMVPSARDLNGPVSAGPLTENGPATTDEWSRGDGRMVPSPRDPAPQYSSKNPQKQQQRAPRKSAGAQQRLPQHIMIIQEHTDATDDEAQAVAQLVADEKAPTNLPGFLRRLADDGELPDWLARVRQTNARAGRSEFVARIQNEPDCEHGVAGGHIPYPPTGWVACPHERRRLGTKEPTAVPDRLPPGMRVSKSFDGFRQLNRDRAVLRAQEVWEEIQRLRAAGQEDQENELYASLPDDVLDVVERLEAAQRYAPPKANGRASGHQPYGDAVDPSAYYGPL